MSYILNNEIQFSDSTNIDAFSRLRVSEPFNLFSYSQTLTSGDTYFENYRVGTGSLTFLPNEVATQFSVTSNNDIARREQHGYNFYQPGKSQLVLLTGIFGTAVSNTRKYIGYYNDSDGLYFGTSGTTFGVYLRTSTSGSVVETFIPQSNWNIDTLITGSTLNPSGKHLDITKANIYIINFQWLGVGRVIFALDIDGIITPVHELLNANNKTAVYMKTGNLPIRYEVISTGGSDNTFKQICSTVISEGGQDEFGYPTVVSNGLTVRTFAAKQAVISVRLNALFEGRTNRMKAAPIGVEVFTTSTNTQHYWELILQRAHLNELNLGGSPTWTDVAGTPFQQSINGTTVTSGITIASGFMGASNDRTEAAVIPTKDFISLNMSGTSSDWLHLVVTPSASAGISGKIHLVARY